MEKETKKNWLKEHKMSVFVVVSAVVMLIGLSYAWLQITLRGNKELTLIAAGTLYLELDDSMAGGISMDRAIPVTDTEGISQDGYTFTLENKGKIASEYTIYLDDLDLAEGQTRMTDSVVKYQLTKDGREINLQLLSGTGVNPERVLDSGYIDAGKKYTYNLKMWIDADATNEIMGTVFKGQLRIEGMQRASNPSASEELLAKTNPTTLTYANATSDQKKEMFTFTHTAGEQQVGWSEEELTDYRYIGTSVNNYVTFNNETWRIIGVFTVEDDAGKKEKRMKIIRDQSIGNYSFDNKPSGTGSSDNAYGSSYWVDSRLKDVLNSGVYYNRISGNCPSGANNATVTCNFSSTGLTVDAKSMIGKAKWYLGGIDVNGNTLNSYKDERGTKVGKIGREISWIGEVGLMYPSDYGYAATGNGCLSTSSLYNYNEICKKTDWLFVSTSRYTITPSFDKTFNVIAISSTGSGVFMFANDSYTVYPSVYLKSSVKIASGDGSEENPYQLLID